MASASPPSLLAAHERACVPGGQSGAVALRRPRHVEAAISAGIRSSRPAPRTRPPPADPVALNRQLVVPTPNVLHQRMPRDDQPRAPLLLETRIGRSRAFSLP